MGGFENLTSLGIVSRVKPFPARTQKAKMKPWWGHLANPPGMDFGPTFKVEGLENTDILLLPVFCPDIHQFAACVYRIQLTDTQCCERICLEFAYSHVKPCFELF